MIKGALRSGPPTAKPQARTHFESKNVEIDAETQLGIESMNRTPRAMSAFNCNFPRALRHPRYFDPLPPVEQCRRIALQRSIGQLEAVQMRQ